MKIAFIGTHSTGKTTVFNELKKYLKDYTFYTEIIREMIKNNKNIPINEESSILTQTIFFNYYLNMLWNKDNFISDRSIIDVFSYTFYLYKRNLDFYPIYKIQKEFVLEDWKKYDYLFYFPIEFDLVEDGVRSKDPKFRKEIANIMEDFIDQHNIKVYKVTGSLNERLNFILKNLKVKGGV